MKIRYTLTFLAVLGMASVSSAAMRTFEITFPGDSGNPDRTLSPVSTVLNFSYVDGAFATNDNVSAGELTSGLTINHSSLGDFSLSQIRLIPNSRYVFYFTPLFAAPGELRITFDGLDFRKPSGTDLPDGSEGNAFTAYYDLPTDMSPNSAYSTNPSITIGTVAVPEPSAFGFGALALTVTGIGRWARRRFFAA